MSLEKVESIIISMKKIICYLLFYIIKFTLIYNIHRVRESMNKLITVYRSNVRLLNFVCI